MRHRKLQSWWHLSSQLTAPAVHWSLEFNLKIAFKNAWILLVLLHAHVHHVSPGMRRKLRPWPGCWSRHRRPCFASIFHMILVTNWHKHWIVKWDWQSHPSEDEFLLQWSPPSFYKHCSSPCFGMLSTCILYLQIVWWKFGASQYHLSLLVRDVCYVTSTLAPFLWSLSAQGVVRVLQNRLKANKGVRHLWGDEGRWTGSNSDGD